MRNLAIDIGNTKTKIAVFDDKNLLFYETVGSINPDLLSGLIAEYEIKNSILSNVHSSQEALVTFLTANTNYFPFSIERNTGIKNFYKSGNTLGLDRWAKIIAAHQLYAQQDCLIIDMGTCITYDFLSMNAEYYGGSISLGIQMRFSALEHYTGKLALIKWDKDNNIPLGRDTESAIKSGVLNGVVHELEGFISLEYKKNNAIKIMVTGGDATFLLVQFKNSIFAPHIIHDPYLVLKGLNEVIAFEYV